MGVEIRNVGFSYGNQSVLENISCTFEPGYIYAILGVNGAGKSTVINLLGGFLKPDNGAIYLNRENINKYSLAQIAKEIAFVPQQQQLIDLTVSDYLLLGRIPYVHWQSGNADEELVFRTLETLNLTHLALRPLRKLSGGELQKTALARALVQQPKILLLDEPTSSLDMKNQIEVMEIVARETSDKKLITILSMHDVNLALRYADRFVLMKERGILDSGGLEVMTDTNLTQLYGVSVQIHRTGKMILAIPQ